MKNKVMVIDGDSRVEADISFDIFDARNTSLYSENTTIERAKNTKDALNQYLKKKGFENLKFIRSSAYNCEFCVKPFYVVSGFRYKAGNRVWYKII